MQKWKNVSILGPGNLEIKEAKVTFGMAVMFGVVHGWEKALNRSLYFTVKLWQFQNSFQFCVRNWNMCRDHLRLFCTVETHQKLLYDAELTSWRRNDRSLSERFTRLIYNLATHERPTAATLILCWLRPIIVVGKLIGRNEAYNAKWHLSMLWEGDTERKRDSGNYVITSYRLSNLLGTWRSRNS